MYFVYYFGKQEAPGVQDRLSVLRQGRKITALQESRLMFQVSGMPQSTAAFGHKKQYLLLLGVALPI